MRHSINIHMPPKRGQTTVIGSVILILASQLYALDASTVIVRPQEYGRALRNPHKGFTNRGFGEDNEWATLIHDYVPWNQIENEEADGIEKINQWADTRWQAVAQRNQKVIPRVYLHWDGDRKYWPMDMRPDDYSSDQFIYRVTRLVERLGICWDSDPRVAHVELGLIGKWGEHHSPAPTPEMQQVLGDAFTAAFPHKQVLVRHPWREFTAYAFGAYWDSWAHADQMTSHGEGVKSMGDRWKRVLIGGEVAYNWGAYRVQPGDSPTDTVSDPIHREFLINTIRSLHCTQLRWVADYDQADPVARAGAEEVQRAFGYRFVVTEVRYPGQIRAGTDFEVTFDVINTGSAPFYHDWPVAVSLLEPQSGNAVWQKIFADTDIRQWMPGDQWNESRGGYEQKARAVTVAGLFELSPEVKPGLYQLALAVLDPAGDLPCLRFAIQNYRRGGWHPIGYIGVGQEVATTHIDPRRFDDPALDKSLWYVP